MKTKIILTLCILMGTYSNAQSNTNQKKDKTMKTFVIEREIPNAGKLTPEELRGISKKSNTVLTEMSSGIKWLHSYVTDDKVFCLYKAESTEAIMEHAEKGGFPANKISVVSATIDPRTGS